MKLVTIYRTLSPIDAQLLRSRLEAAGFHPELAHENVAFNVEGGAFATGGVYLQVPEDEAEEAREIISDMQTASSAE